MTGPAWQQDRDGWECRQQQWGEPSDFGHAYAFVSRGIIYARGAGVAAVDRVCEVVNASRQWELAA